MIYASIILFALAAVFGVYLLIKIFNKTSPARPAVYLHGLLAAIALVILIYFAVTNPGNYPMASLIIFIVAALGGFFLFYNDIVKKKPGPVSVAFIHAFAAVIAFVLLLVFVFI